MIDDLLAFTRCSVAGCEWRIQMRPGMVADRCFEHRGPALAQYYQDTDGAIIRTRFLPRELDPSYEPDPAA